MLQYSQDPFSAKREQGLIFAIFSFAEDLKNAIT